MGPPRRPGAVTGAAAILMIAGALSVVFGSMSLSGDRVAIDAAFLENESARRVASAVLVLLGALALLAGWLILRLRPAGRTLGIAVALLGILSGLAQIRTTGSAGLLTLALDAFVLYALIAYGFVFRPRPVGPVDSGSAGVAQR